MNKQSDDYDSPWKKILEAYFQEFVVFFFPAAAEGIDWSRGYAFLDKELQQIVLDAELGKRLADKLVQVWRKDGDDAWVLAHVEVQGQERPDFAKRMFVYNYRIFDRYDRPVASLAVLSDERTGWRPDHFGYELWGCKVGISFPVAKVNDYAERWDELEASDNPFAIVVMAHLKTRDTRNDEESRKKWKLYLVRRLYERGYRREDVINLFHFIDWLMRLPEGMEESFWAEMHQYEEGKKMEYISSVERIGIKKGIEQGMQQGFLQALRGALVDVLEERFETVSQTLRKSLRDINDPEVLKSLHKKALHASSLEEFMDAVKAALA
jgi:hypothetical protein